MAKTATKGLMGSEDLSKGTGTFTRTDADGTTGTYTQLSLDLFTSKFIEFTDQASAPAAPGAAKQRLYTSTADGQLRVRTPSATLILVDDTAAQTIAGVKTFSSIPVLPASNPTTGNQAARKTYVDLMAPLAGATFTGAVDVSAGGLTDNSRRVVSKHTVSNSTITVTGATTETDMASSTIAANLLGTTGGIEILGAGTLAGTAGTKTLRLYFGSTVIGSFAFAAANVSDWFVRATIFNTATNAQRVVVEISDGGPTLRLIDYTTAAIDTTANVTVKCTGQLANAADTIAQTMWLIKAII